MNDRGLDNEGLSSRLPGIHTLRAALTVTGLVDADGSGIDDLHASYPHVPTGGLLSSEDLLRGEELLLQVGLLLTDGTKIRADERLAMLASAPLNEGQELLLAMILENAPPLWLGAAVEDGELRPELISDEDDRVLKQVFDDSEERERILLNQGARVDPDALKHLGNLGERYVYETYREIVAAGGGNVDEVLWVARFSDRHGYDVSVPREAPSKHRCEVKTTRSLGSTFTVKVSRHEIETGKDYPFEWVLVTCRADDDDQVEAIGWTRVEALEPLLPKDQHPAARWSVVEVELRVDDLTPGLPPLST
jgi:Domain of unknown function (DUF3883)